MADPPKEKQTNGQAKEEKEPAPTTTFWEFLASLGDRWQTEGLSLYTYRLWPITDTRNPERFLCKLQEPIDEDYLLRNFGSGKYWLLLNNGNGKNLRKYTANPHNPDFPPRVAPQEVIESNPQNKLYFEVWTRKEGHPAAKQRTEQNGAEAGNGSDSAVKELASLVKLAFGDRRKDEADTVTKTLIDWALAQKDKERADNSPTAVANLVKEIKTIMPAQQPAAVDPLTIVEKVLSIQNKGSAQSRTESDIEKLWNLVERAQGRGEREPMQGMKDTIELFSSIKELFKPETPAAAATASPDADLLEKIAVNLSGQVGPLVAGIPGIIAAFKGTPMVPPPLLGATTPAGMTAFNPYDPAAMRAFTQAQKAAAAAPTLTQPPTPPPTGTAPNVPPGAPPNPASQAPPPANELAALVQQYGGLVVNHLNIGTTGWGFADYVVGLLGTATHAQICAQGEPALVAALLAVPEITMFGESRLRKFVHEFIHFEEYGDEEEEEDQQEPNKRKVATMRE